MSFRACSDYVRLFTTRVACAKIDLIKIRGAKCFLWMKL